MQARDNNGASPTSAAVVGAKRPLLKDLPQVFTAQSISAAEAGNLSNGQIVALLGEISAAWREGIEA